jgi:hypothetical protein
MTLVMLIPFSLPVLGVVRVLSLLGFLVLMTVLVLLLALLVLGFAHGEPSTLVDDLCAETLQGKITGSGANATAPERR